ncbi:glycosyltransferase 52 family protein [Salinivibrio sp. YCSC6]|uniref:glycosyltransferase 52 family protein n=1 Tax=Salinivibrio sp. YCSC6 TaxID=2003370 RepID=UPI000BBCBFB9|nr:glycosyltransferase 52 family protein [Salinivibrio sp. YCSC6]PCE67635.1 glycosyltransferase 52 family protein [Salinivibrio sp. YCSC6]QCF35465.1 glycosyltransferase 52 family protein [Salinivibrio sp. YCSC6]
MNLFLVTSPFQYLCALEAKKHYQTKNNVLFLVNQSSSLGIEQQEKIFNPRDWDYVITTTRKNRTINIPRAIKEIKNISKGNHIDTFFYGEYNAWRTKLVAENFYINKDVYFDDGTLTINELHEFIEPQETYSRSRPLQDFLLKLYGCKPTTKSLPRENLELFTIFDLNSNVVNIEKNTFRHLKARYNHNNLFSEHAPVGFIGQGAVGHKGGQSVSSYIDRVSQFSKGHEKGIIYFPHRTESQEVSEKIASIKNLTYHRSTLPLELELIDKKIQLSCLYGMNSTAQYTAKVFYPKMPIYNLIPHNEKLSPRNERIRLLYKASGIKELLI